MAHPILRFGLIAALAAPLAAAPPLPDPNSLLATRRVLFLTGAESDHHIAPRANAVALAQRLKSSLGFTLDLADHPAALTSADLARYDLIVASYVPSIDTQAAKPFGKALKQWLAEGNKGFVGLHSTGANSPGQWEWFRDSVLSMRYREHMDGEQRGTVRISADAGIRALPVLAGLPEQASLGCEWYSFDLPPKAAAAPTWPQCQVLYALDEGSLKLKDPMGYHPAAWIRTDANGNRFFYTLMAHSDAGSLSEFFQGLVMRGLEYASGYRSVTTLRGERPLTRIGPTGRSWIWRIEAEDGWPRFFVVDGRESGLGR